MRNRRLWSNILRIGISLVAVFFLLRDVGSSDIAGTLRHAKIGWLVFALVLFMLGLAVRAFRWRALLAGLGLRPAYGRLLKLYLVGQFFNTFLPSGFGGDVIRVVEFAQDDNPNAAFGTVLVDRMTGLLSQMMLGLLVLPFAPDLASWLRWTFVAISTVGLVGGYIVLDGRLLRRFSTVLPARLSLTGDGKLAQLYAAVTSCGPHAIRVSLALSTIFNLINITIHYACGQSVGLQVPVIAYFIVVPLLSMTLLIPISVGGLGARDWVAQPLMATFGVAKSQVAAWTLLVWANTAAAGLIGGVVYLYDAITGLTRKR